MKVTVIGASGYSGGELLRLIDGHPELSLHKAIAHSNAGEPISAIHPQLFATHLATFEGFAEEHVASADLIFLALPHGESGKLIQEHEKSFAGKKIVDLGADFRLNSTAAWERYYGGKHHGSWAYGLPELPGARTQIASANRIANPGCYATAISLAIAPLVALATKVNLGDIVVTAASGTTGAGRSTKVNLIGSEVMNSLSAYKVGGVHQHTPEIEQALAGIAHQEIALSFTPFLAPLPRGILASISIPIENSSLLEIRDTFRAHYEQEKFIHLLPEGAWPQTNSLIGSNSVAIQVAFDEHVGRAIIVSAIDNLGKGAAGQALQNANVMLGFDEAAGLSTVGVR